MLNILKNKKIIIFAFLLLTITSVFITHNVFNKKEVEKVFEENKVNKKQFAMYVKDSTDDSYTEYTDSELFPDSSMYTFNEEKSYCVDNKDNVLENVISYDSGKVTITSNKSLYCYLYFDGDSIPPIISVDIIDNYYTSAKLSILSNEDGTYCINTSNVSKDTSNCVLEGTLSENSMIVTKMFTESNTYYVHVKDKFGNVTISSALDIEVLYQKVEYIETTGTQLIKTDYYPTAQTMLRLKFNGDTTGGTVFGGRNSESDGFLYFNYNNQVYLDYGSGSGYNRIYGGSVSSNVTYEFEIGNRYIKNMNTGVNVISGTTVSFNKKNFTADIANEYSGKIYYLQVFESDNLVRNFVPVYRISDNVIGMFDDVNKKFYTNSGSGTFGKGNDIGNNDNIDTEPPTNNSVSINSGDSYTTSTSVTLTLASTGATQMCISNTSSCSSWETYAASKTHTLTTGDGTKTVYVWFRDAAGNTTSYVTDTITLDTTAPTSNSVSINSGASSTTSTSVTLTLSSSGATQMCISNTSSCSSWEDYATSKSWTLTTGDGTKTVYVWFRDAAGNTTSYVTDTITLSTATYVCSTNTALGTCLKSAKTAGFNSTMEGGLYRYQGTSSNVNNYVCFGTSTKSTCTGDTNTYMYRIIGVDSSNRVKLIKSGGFNVAWHSTNDTGSEIYWPSTTLYSDFNGSSFYTNTTYVPTSWQSKIATYSWKYGILSETNQSAAAIYSVENGYTSTVSAKIGLAYVHDYYYAYQSGGVNCSQDANLYTECIAGWIDESWNFTLSSAPYSSTYKAQVWTYRTNGYIVDSNPSVSRSGVKPVFYLTSSVNYISGSGTASDPFIIS